MNVIVFCDICIEFFVLHFVCVNVCCIIIVCIHLYIFSFHNHGRCHRPTLIYKNPIYYEWTANWYACYVNCVRRLLQFVLQKI